MDDMTFDFFPEQGDLTPLDGVEYKLFKGLIVYCTECKTQRLVIKKGYTICKGCGSYKFWWLCIGFNGLIVLVEHERM